MKLTHYATVRGVGFAVWVRRPGGRDIAVELTTPFGMFALDLALEKPS